MEFSVRGRGVSVLLLRRCAADRREIYQVREQKLPAKTPEVMLGEHEVWEDLTIRVEEARPGAPPNRTDSGRTNSTLKRARPLESRRNT